MFILSLTHRYPEPKTPSALACVVMGGDDGWNKGIRQDNTKGMAVA